MEKNDYRGKCFSTHGKLTKTGDLKRSGNFSAYTHHLQSVQIKDYRGKLIQTEHGIPQIVFGETQTPLAEIMGEDVASLVLNDRCFESYTQRDVLRIENKEYEAVRTLTKLNHSITADYMIRIMIYTDGDFKYNFREY